jgi:hypothetical protein
MKGYNETIRQLSEKDKKAIKFEKRIAYIFSVFVFLFGLLFNLYFILAELQDSGDLKLLLSIDVGILLICYMIIFFMNRKYNADLKENTKIVKVKQVITKYQETSYEAGSGVLYIPILGNLFPKLWGQKMRPLPTYYFNIDNYRNEIEEELYDMVKDGDLVEMHYAKNSNLLLAITIFEGAN